MLSLGIFRFLNLGSGFSSLFLQEGLLAIDGVLYQLQHFVIVHNRYGKLSKKIRTLTCLHTRLSMFVI